MRSGWKKRWRRWRVITREYCFYNRYGNFIYKEPAGLYAGYDVPQFSIHRGDLQMVLLDAFIARAGADRIVTGWRCTGADADTGAAHFVDAASGKPLESQRGQVVVSCEGIHSALRKQSYPDEGPPKYSGINMWRGVTRWLPMLSGATMVRIGWHHPAKVLLYPIRDAIDATGRQLFNWVVDIETAQYQPNDWNRPGNLADFIGAFEDWKFDWLDVPAFIRSADRSSNIRWSIRIRCRAGISAVSRCSATPRIRCTRAVPTAPRRRYSMRGRSPMP